MADSHGFLKHHRHEAPKRPVSERIGDWHEVYQHHSNESIGSDLGITDISQQAARCMDCGVPFCHSGSAGCPLGNLIPEWNDLVRRGMWQQASDQLHATNNFPEFTGRLCPAPCEAACVLAIAPESGGAVTIKRVEQAIADVSWEQDLISPAVTTTRTGKSIAVVGSGPAGLAAAQQLVRVGHEVTVFERDDRLGGLLRYGIPEYKMAKKVLDRRLTQLRAEGIRFITHCEVGVDITVDRLKEQFDAIILAVGALRGRDDTTTPGRKLRGIHLAMDHLIAANRWCEGDNAEPKINAAGKHVVIIGGGDTGADCYGTAIRQGALSVTQLDQYPMPPTQRDDEQSPWPVWPWILRTYPAHEEGGQRRFAVAVEEFVGNENGEVNEIRLREVQITRNEQGHRVVTPRSDSVESLPADLVLLAIGFAGVEHMPLLSELGISLSEQGIISCEPDWQTSSPGVFVCGDAHRGASLIVWAIAEGRSAARAVDQFLVGDSTLPAPVTPANLPLVTL